MVPDFSWFNWMIALKITVAAILGGLIGLEREIHGHAAGLRTNIMIAVSACLFTILSIEAFPLTPDNGMRDTARVAAQIVSGVGFLGAGAMFQSRDKVHGLTTAATIWLVAAVGMAVGSDAYFSAIFAVALALIVLAVLAPVSRRLEQRARQRLQKKQ